MKASRLPVHQIDWREGGTGWCYRSVRRCVSDTTGGNMPSGIIRYRLRILLTSATAARSDTRDAARNGASSIPV